MSPRELGLLFNADAEIARDALLPAALICAVMANIHRDPDRTEPYTPAYFLPGAQSKEDEMREFADRVLSGEQFESDPEGVATFRRQLEAAFGNLRSSQSKP